MKNSPWTPRRETGAPRVCAILLSCALIPTILSAQDPIYSPGMTPARMQEMWRNWSDGTVPHFEIPERMLEETLSLLAYYLNESPVERVNFIDVGCAVGDYLVFLQPKVSKDLFSIGIDPIDWRGRATFSVFEQIAITNQPEGEYEFHLYGADNLATSSLSRLAEDHVTHDPTEQEEKFYHPLPIERSHGTERVQALHLSSVIKKHQLSKEVVHFVKIDVQGTDLDAFLSMRRYARKTLFVQLEMIYSENEKLTLYEGQGLFKDEAPAIERLGFRVFNVARFPHGPEADVVFVNKKLFKKLLPDSLGPTR